MRSDVEYLYTTLSLSRLLSYKFKLMKMLRGRTLIFYFWHIVHTIDNDIHTCCNVSFSYLVLHAHCSCSLPLIMFCNFYIIFTSTPTNSFSCIPIHPLQCLQSQSTYNPQQFTLPPVSIYVIIITIIKSWFSYKDS